MNQRIKKIYLNQFLSFLKFVFFLFAINSIFYFFYYRGLSLKFTFVTAFFVFLFIINYALSLHILKYRWFRFSLIIFGFLLGIYTLINFAYYDVFGAFWKLNLGQLQSTNKSLANLLASYYGLVPFYIYLSLIILYFLLIFSSKYYLKKHDKLTWHFKRYRLRANFIKSKRIDPLKIFVSLAVFIVFNCFFYFSLGFYQKISNQPDFSRRQYFSDLGVYGHFYQEITNLIFQNKNVAAAKTIQSPVSSAAFLPESKSDLNLIKANQQALFEMSFTGNNQAISRPALNRPHIIIYQMESVADWPLKLDPSPMPFLKELMANNVSVDKFFANSCITINAEFSVLCGFLPEASGPISDLFSQNRYYCLPTFLKDKLGYQTSIHHANDPNFWNRKNLAPLFGFEKLFFTDEYSLRENDGDVLIDIVDKVKKSAKPTFSYMIGFTTHGPHNQAFIDYNSYNNKLFITPYAQNLPDFVKTSDQTEETLRIYLGFLKAADDGIEKLFSELQKNNLLSNTIVVIFGDHRYYNFYGENKLENFYNYNQIPLAIYVPGADKIHIGKLASQLDIAPTLLSLLNQPENIWPASFIGQSIFSNKQSNSVINKCLGQSYFINDEIIITHDNLTEGNYVHYFIKDSAREKFELYGQLLADIADRSDKVIKENSLIEDNGNQNSVPFLNQSFQARSINLNQEADGDHDGLSNLREETLLTDPENPDTDGDGFLDGVEVMFEWDPLSSETIY